MVIQVLGCLGQLSSAYAGDPTPKMSFDDVAKAMTDMSEIIFANSCTMGNGHIGALIYRQADRRGWYFELNGSQTVLSEQAVDVNGGYEIAIDAAPRYIDKRDAVVRHLLNRAFFMIGSYDMDMIKKMAQHTKCYENDDDYPG